MSEDEGAADRRQVQMFITAIAGYVADKTRERQEQAQRAAAGSADRSRVVQAQLAAERASAQTLWQPTLQTGWWSHATVIDVQRAYQAAAEWAPFDENASHAAELIARRVGVDPAVTDQQQVESAETISQTRNLAPEEASDAPNAEWDTRERRAEALSQLAEAYTSVGVSKEVADEAVEADRIADLAQARPASEAVAARPAGMRHLSTAAHPPQRKRIAHPSR